MVKKALKIPKALKMKPAGFKNGASRLVGRGRGVHVKPLPGEDPIVMLRVQVIACKDLVAKDRGGTSDPFIHLSLLTTRFTTPVVKKTLSPNWTKGTATFDFPIYLSMGASLGMLELVIWDKDMIRKDYLGEVSVSVTEWFGREQERPFAFEDPNNTPFSLPVLSTRSNTSSSGTLTLKVGFVQPPNATVLLEFEEIYGELVKRERRSLVSAPPTEGVGTIRSHTGIPSELVEQYEDDGGISSDSCSSDSEDEADDGDFADAPDDMDALTPTGRTQRPVAPAMTPSTSTDSTTLFPPRTPNLAITPPSPGTPPLKSPSAPSTPTQGTAKPKSPFMRMKFPRRNTGSSISSISGPPTPTEEDIKEKKKRFRKSFPTPSLSRKGSTNEGVPKVPRRERKKKPYSFTGSNDIVGIVMLEIKCAEDLPRLKNMTRTGWDMDPFVVISFGKKVFRTRVIRHSRNPMWEEKLLFHVRRFETNFKISLSVLDWDKLSSNDLIGEGQIEVGDLIANFKNTDTNDGLDLPDHEGSAEDKDMKEYKVPISTGGNAAWEALFHPVLTVRAKYQPYAELRKKFWTQYLKQYDTDDTLSLSHIEITSMLDSLGSTLTRKTISGWWEHLGKDPATDELTISEAVECLEEELSKEISEKRMAEDDSGTSTPFIALTGQNGEDIKLEELDFLGHTGAGEAEIPHPPVITDSPQQSISSASASPLAPTAIGRRMPSYSSSEDGDEAEAEEYEEEELSSSSAVVSSSSSPGTPAIGGVRKNKIKSKFRRKGKKSKTSASSSSGGPSPDASLERVINVKNCPLCHRPRLNSKAEVDIITHLAVCASSDWSKIGSISVHSYVTGAQAQRKWVTKAFAKISAGNYKLGANSANIIVQDRITGSLQEEKMQVYVRLGIRLLYKGTSRMEGARARKLLKSMSVKQGLKYDSVESGKDILPFIEFHKLNVDEILDPLDSYKTFNQFFYRKLKPEARPIEEPENPFRLVSAADCRLMVFESVAQATQLWIKGRDFTIAKLLGDTYKSEAPKYEGGAVAIFRLAPQDYHRFHSSVDGKIGKMEYISGEYYTVNPQAIRTSLDVYGENARKIVPIDSPQFGRVMAVCVGAMMVGTIKTTVTEGEAVKRGQEFGYFAFGGSTIVMVFEPGKVQWDEDILNNSRSTLETLVRVGMGLGRGVAQ